MKIFYKRLGELTQEQEQLCRQFAEQCVPTNKDEYARRNQKNPEKIKNDVYQGKKAEFLVYNYFSSKEKEINPPDLKIYKKK